MTNMTKELKTWGDLDKRYKLILFNNCTEIDDGAVFEEYLQSLEEDKDEEKEIFQWYVIEIDEDEKDFLNEKYGLNIFYSETLGLFILPVYHFGTSWDYMDL